MVSSLEDAMKMRDLWLEQSRYTKAPLPSVNIEREVKYYAVVDGRRYTLIHDWFVERLDQKLDELDKQEKKSKKPMRGERWK